jgi:hypothetical protein
MTTKTLLMTAPAAAGEFAPSDIGNLVGWWDAADAATVTSSGGLITQWDDKSASGFDVSATGTARPSTSTINSLGAVSFNGSSNFLGWTGSNGVDVTSITVFSVGLWANNSFKGVVAFGHNTGADWNNNNAFVMSTGNRTPNDACDTSRDGMQAFSTLGGATPLSVNTGSLKSAGNDVVRRNGVAGGVRGAHASPYGAALGPISIGTRVNANAFNTDYLNGTLCEIIVYEAELSAGEITDVETYLNDKWAVY